MVHEVQVLPIECEGERISESGTGAQDSVAWAAGHEAVARAVRRPVGAGAIPEERDTASAFDDGRDHRRGDILGPGRIPEVQDGYVQ